MEIGADKITVGVLAGGEGRRLGGVDKGWYAFDGAPLIEHTLARVRPQAARVLINANRCLSRYRALGYPVCVDDGDDWRGPIAGIAAILRTAMTPYVLIVPVDTPWLPVDLAHRLAEAMTATTQAAIADSGGQRQPLHALMHRDVLDDLETALFAGIRGVQQWQARLNHTVVAWPAGIAFTGINAQQDAQSLLAQYTRPTE